MYDFFRYSKNKKIKEIWKIIWKLTQYLFVLFVSFVLFVPNFWFKVSGSEESPLGDKGAAVALEK